MATTNDTADRATPIPTGVWRVDAAASELGFGARGMFGLVPARGTFGEFEGTLTVDHDGARGELRIQATTLDTRNARRDQHLRSTDFFDVESHPTVTFELTALEPAAAGTSTLTGVLRIRESALAVDTPVQVSAAGPDRIALHTTLDVDRAAAGVGWSKMGMIKGKARLEAKITLARES